MLPKMMPFSVEATLTLARMLAKSCGARMMGDGFSTSFRSPSVTSSSVQFRSVSDVWFTISTSSTMSYWFTLTYASA